MTANETAERMEMGRQVTARRLAEQICECDPTVLSLMVIDRQGQVLSAERSDRLADEERIDEEALPKLGVVSQLIIGAAGNVAEYLGRLQYLTGEFKKQTVMLIHLREYEMTLALRLNRSANPEYIYSKIANILGTR